MRGNEIKYPRHLRRATVNVSIETHREMKIAAASRGQNVVELLEIAWKQFKASEGKNLLAPQRVSAA